jgi:hypothetical protein
MRVVISLSAVILCSNLAHMFSFASLYDVQRVIASRTQDTTYLQFLIECGWEIRHLAINVST